MPRDYARIQSAIWENDDFLRLRRDDQWLYLTLLTQHDLSICGVLARTPTRWAGYGQTTTGRIRLGMRRLEDAHFIVDDAATEETLIRSLIRHDRALMVPNSAISIARRFTQIRSPSIRSAIVKELDRLRVEQPRLAGWNVAELNDLLDNPDRYITGNP